MAEQEIDGERIISELIEIDCSMEKMIKEKQNDRQEELADPLGCGN